MGGCCLGGDLVPPPPLLIKPDPQVNDTLRVYTARLGFFGASRDLGIWDANEPDAIELPKEKIWLWFNKSNMGGLANIDLENFFRGHDPNNMNKGQVLWSVSFVDRLQYQTFQRFQNTGRDNFVGFMKEGFKNYDDDHYVKHKSHQAGHGNDVKGHMITKWSMTSQANIKAGNTGRSAGMLSPSAYYRLDVFSTGTVVTTYTEVEVKDEEGRVHKEMRKSEKEFVDRVEFRLNFFPDVSGHPQVVSTWMIPGDSANSFSSSSDATMTCPWFNSTALGGWFSRSKYLIETKSGVDPALAVLVAHLCNTEYSVADVKRDLQVNTPARPPAQLHGPTNVTLNIMFS